MLNNPECLLVKNKNQKYLEIKDATQLVKI